MRFLHTSDWHLGHTLHEMQRGEEQREFLDWLVSVIWSEKLDALLLSGDVFDTANPSAEAQEMWYQFLARAVKASPGLQIVVTGGNHDSASRLDAPQVLLQEFGVQVVGGLRWEGGRMDAESLVFPLKGEGGLTEAWVAAVPYIKPSDIPSLDLDEAQDPMVEGVRHIYRQVLDVARGKREAGQSLIAMGHLYLARGALSELSERKVLGGNQHALPADIFPSDVTYVALGHLHLAQSIAEDRIRYSGAPLPFDVAEAHYPNQVLLVETEGAQLREIRPLRVPRTCQMKRIPARGSLGLHAALEELKKLPVGYENGRETILEVDLVLEGPEPTLRHEVEAAIEGKGYRLVRIAVAYSGQGRSEPCAPEVNLEEMAEEEVLAASWSSHFGSQVDAEVLSLFREVVERVLRGDPDEATVQRQEVRS